MPTPIAAVYQGGVFRPAVPPDLPDGTAVHLVVVPTPPAPPARDPAAVLARILAVAAKPNEPGVVDDGVVVSENVDAILYGTRGDPGDVR